MGLEFGVWGSGFRVWGAGFRVWGLGCRVQGSGVTRCTGEDGGSGRAPWNLNFMFRVLGSRVGFRFSGFGARVSDSEFRA